MELGQFKKTALICTVVLLCLLGILLSVFLIGRFGWRLWGFRACESAGIERVEVSEDCVEIAGFYPGSFPEGFLGYYAEEVDGKLYVGFRFSAVFGFFETGSFSVSIPVRSEINQVVMKTSAGEYTLWKLEGGQIPGSEQYGIYIRLDCPDVGTVSISYCGKTVEYDTLVWEQGEYVFFDCDLMQEAKNTEGPVPFVLTLKKSDGSPLSCREFLFEAEMEKMYIRITESGKMEGRNNES